MERTICIFNERRSGDLICTDFVYETGDVQAKISSRDGFVLGIVERGRGTLFAEKRELSIREEEAFFIPRNLPYRLKFDGDLAYYYVVFYGRRASELLLRIGASEASVYSVDSAREEILPFCRDCIRRAKNGNRDILGEAVLLYIIAHLGDDKAPTEELLSKMIEITNEEYKSVHFSLATLAERLSYSAKYLSLYFKKKKGMCYTQYLRALRLDHATFLMEQGIASVKSIALLSGFADSLYFSKLFKAERGVSPKDYIAKVTAKSS